MRASRAARPPRAPFSRRPASPAGSSTRHACVIGSPGVKRKRSHRIGLPVIATGGAAAALATWLDDTSPPSETGTAGETMFRDAAECRQSYDDATCDEKFAEAKTEHDRLAPKYATRDDCEREIGADLCTVTDAPPARAE